MNVLGVIPARYASTRFPGKPLAMIGGKSMISRVYEQSLKSRSLDRVVVATDDQRIYDHVAGFGGDAVMTSDKHPSGTDRIGEVLERLGKEGATFDLVVNIQGDEPFIDPSQIDLAVSAFSQDEVQISTLVRRINSKEELFSPNVVKALVASGGKALCFSRLPVPFLRGVEQSQWADKHVFYKHIGLYAFRSQVLKELVRLQPSPIEMAESLEQMRWIENGYSIYTQVTNFESIAVDTPGDLSKFTNIP